MTAIRAAPSEQAMTAPFIPALIASLTCSPPPLLLSAFESPPEDPREAVPAEAGVEVAGGRSVVSSPPDARFAPSGDHELPLEL